MCVEFGEVTVIIDLVINILAFISPLLTFRDTSSHIIPDSREQNRFPRVLSQKFSGLRLLDYRKAQKNSSDPHIKVGSVQF